MSEWDRAMDQLMFYAAVASLVAVGAIAVGVGLLCYQGYRAFTTRHDPTLNGPWSDKGDGRLPNADGVILGQEFIWT